MKIEAVLEFNDKGYLAQACNFPGVFGRSLYKEEALGKLLEDLKVYCQWLGKDFSREIFEVVVVNDASKDETEYVLRVLQEIYPNLNVVNLFKNVR